MPRNTNPRVKELLAWHGHACGGVHVPFQSRAKPLSGVIVTPLIQRLRRLAAELATQGPGVPRCVFLVGGPGNGKSETVEDFLRHLDTELGSAGELVACLATKFAPDPKVQRRVEVTAQDVPETPDFATKIDRMIVVQDATATDDAAGNAAREFADDIADVLTASSPPLFLACVNRGLLARAVAEAVTVYSTGNQATALLTAVLKATGLGRTVLAIDRPSCWPLQDHPAVACWPMDLESLLISPAPTASPIDQVFEQATAIKAWEVRGGCSDCDARQVCPFRQNAEWLRDPQTWNSLRRILRHGELRSGQRWNFRDAFSLAANLLVGDTVDFRSATHPCEWVHNQANALGGDPCDDVLRAHELVRHLYPHALFPVQLLSGPAEELANLDRVRAGGHPTTVGVLDALAGVPATFESPIRQLLARDLAPLDPARETPRSRAHRLAAIELEYCQAVAQGNDAAHGDGLAAIEVRLLGCIAQAEQEWDMLQRSSNEASTVVQLLRRYACILVKRSVGVRCGHHADEELLADYENTIHDVARLQSLMPELQKLTLGADGFRFNLVESYGQPRSEEGAWQVKLCAGKVPLRARAAPIVADPNLPNHDVPSFRISEHWVPITFPFYRALRLRAAGCMNSSLPASVRASLDRVRHMHAGRLCRNRDELMSNTMQILFSGRMELRVLDVTLPPQLTSTTSLSGKS